MNRECACNVLGESFQTIVHHIFLLHNSCRLVHGFQPSKAYDHPAKHGIPIVVKALYWQVDTPVSGAALVPVLCKLDLISQSKKLHERLQLSCKVYFDLTKTCTNSRAALKARFDPYLGRHKPSTILQSSAWSAFHLVCHLLLCTSPLPQLDAP